MADYIYLLLNIYAEYLGATSATDTWIQAPVNWFDTQLWESVCDRPGSIPHRIATEASPVTHVSADDQPILLLHGDADRSVPVEQSRGSAKILATAGVTHELVQVEGGGHFPS